VKKIVFVTSSMSRGGAERVISILAEHYRKKGYKVYVVMLWHNIVEYNMHEDIELVDEIPEGEEILDRVDIVESQEEVKEEPELEDDTQKKSNKKK
jgi:hypothetical protein